jgi:hypothetical protein
LFRLEQNLAKLEQEQDDDFNRWTIRSGRGSELLDKFEAEMPAVDEPLATQLEDVEKQEREFDVRKLILKNCFFFFSGRKFEI